LSLDAKNQAGCVVDLFSEHFICQVTVVLMNDWMGPSLSRGGAGNDMSLM
jgi:hypothetical protein